MMITALKTATARPIAEVQCLSYLPRSVQIGKRVFDLVVASLMLIATAPLFPLIALVIRLESRGPALFRQWRVGMSDPGQTRLFHMIKFRSMRADAEARTGAVWASKQDPRITRVGRFLRKTRLDELPQLWNVLRGDMSLVGPRPERPGIVPKLEQQIPFYVERIYGVRPGITGLAQVHQGYDETIEDVRIKVGYDYSYAIRLSGFLGWIKTDLEVMGRTVAVMICGRGQ
jgi:lipopolysaccharide/colanic/teichoic acid biosynthesis glycosyltransferase